MGWIIQGKALFMLQKDDPKGKFRHGEVNAFFESYSP
jgi:hypothetical protein